MVLASLLALTHYIMSPVAIWDIISKTGPESHSNLLSLKYQGSGSCPSAQYVHPNTEVLRLSGRIPNIKLLLSLH